jgi:3-dehydroquinate synthase
LLKYKADRQALLINLGGGVIGDMGGFCASTFKRGIRFINIPTTLLAMVDASIGGKTGIDFMQQKNMIGSFTSPHAIFVDPIFLHTLSSRLLLSGKAEMLKHGLIANEAHFKSCLEVLKPDLALIKESISIKDKIVKHDPYEKGIRKSLNFGHTMGEDLLHGEAVALGMILELKLSVLYAGLDSQLATNIIQNLSKIYGQVKLSPSYITSLIDRCENDKKNNSKGINFSLLGQLGQAQNNVSLSPDEILQIAMN